MRSFVPGVRVAAIVVVLLAWGLLGPAAAQTWTLGVSPAGPGAGTITSSPAGIDCGVTCLADFADGSVVTLTASPDDQSVFSGWSGDCSGVGDCTVTLDQARSVTATFDPRPMLLTVTLPGPGAGTVTSEPPGLSCTTTCSAFFPAGTAVTLTASPELGDELASWSGDCAGAGACSISMTRPRLAVGTFAGMDDSYRVIRHLIPGRSDGRSPLYSEPVTDGVYLYGTTAYGGQWDEGVVYRMRLDGSEFMLLHEFASDWSDEHRPFGALTLTGGTLFGMTLNGGEGLQGAVFRLNPDGTGYTVLHAFAGGVSDGASPRGALTFGDGMLYGMTEKGGESGLGTIFAISPDGTGFEVLHSFGGGLNDGSGPLGSLAFNAGVLYGMTATGGASALGVAFKINPDGTEFSILHSFAGDESDGASPQSALVVAGDLLYGMTPRGGSGNLGCVFRLGTDGASFAVLHAFSSAAPAGYSPSSFLILNSGTLFGTTQSGGTGGRGTVFRIDEDGSGLAVLHSFAGGASDGATPWASLTLAGGVFYGVTSRGGSSDSGAIFRIGVDGSSFVLLHAFGGDVRDGVYPAESLTAGDGVLFGLTNQGGTHGLGTVFRINQDGSGFSIIHSFAGGTLDGASPQGSLTLSGGVLFGMTRRGGLSDKGTLFRINQDGAGYVLLHSFRGGSSNGAFPTGSLTVTDGNLYGVTPYGGVSDKGTVFRISLDGTGFGVMHSFSGGVSDGAYPGGSLAGDGSQLFGTTPQGGAANQGTLFTIGLDGFGFAILHSFSGGTADGSQPGDSVTFDSGVLYGVTWAGGASNWGTVYKVNTAGSDFELVHSFAGGLLGCSPVGSPTLDGGVLFGLAYQCGTDSNGGIFGVGPDGANFAVLHLFAGTPEDGTHPSGSLVPFAGKLYGATSGGAGNTGVVFALDHSHSISGFIGQSGTGVAGVAMVGLPGEPVTDESGLYLARVGTGFSGAVTPTLAGHSFSPVARTYANVVADLEGQDYETTTLTFALEVSKAGTGFGSVSSFPAGITCGDTCSATFTFGSIVTLEPDADPGFVFSGWSGDCSGIAGCQVIMDQARSVVANFSPNTNLLSVARAGTGNGAVTSSPAGIDCGTTCAADFATGALVTLAAAADDSSVFSGWSGDCSGLGDCTVTLDQARSVTATFDPRPMLLTVTLPGPGAGTVTSEPPGLSCTTTCSSFFPVDTAVTLTAASDAGQELASWSGDCEGASGCSVAMTGPQTVVAAFRPVGDAFTVVRHLMPWGHDGIGSQDVRLVSDGVYLYGSLLSGGRSGYGVIFRTRRDGSEYSILHEFQGGAVDGGYPSPLALVDGVLYGTTPTGGSLGSGLLFRLLVDGSGFSALHFFDAVQPNGGLVSDGGMLYGVTSVGGSSQKGTIFAIGIGGAGFSVVHSFAGGPVDGAYPSPPLGVAGGVLFGMTASGGATDQGCVFKVGTGGSGFVLLHSFGPGAGNVLNPVGALVEYDGNLYGTTGSGGVNGYGTVFRVALDGSGFEVVHSFSYPEATYPTSGVTEVGGVLYGTTRGGGANYQGTVFKVNPDGTDFTVLHSFPWGAGYSPEPGALLALDETDLFGVTRTGGVAGRGFVFTLNVDGSSFEELHSFPAGGGDGNGPFSELTLAGGALFGTTQGGGSLDVHTAFRVNPDGSGFQTLHTFTGGESDGLSPHGRLVEDGSVLYGVTAYGGADNHGTVYRLNADGTDFQLLHTFAWSTTNGAGPRSSLLLDGGTLYGTASGGGAQYKGVVFRIEADGSGFEILHSFAGAPADGEGPGTNGLVLIDGVLIGATGGGGAFDHGTIFSVNPDGSNFQVLHSFAGYPSDGKSPQGGLIEVDGVVFGTTEQGGPSWMKGVIFRINPDGSGYQAVQPFTGTLQWPTGTLHADGDDLLGAMAYGGTGAWSGVIYRVGLDGTGFQVLHSLNGGPADGGGSPSGLELVGNEWFGVARNGGSADSGVIFSLRRTLEVAGAVTIGAAGLAGVTLVGLPEAPVTDASGAYTATVPTGWSGTVTPTLTGYGFNPPSRTYSTVMADQVVQDFTATLLSHALDVSRTGAGTGSVTSIPVGIDCGATCSASFVHGTVVTLTATADPGFELAAWSGACSGTGTCVVTMDQARTVGAEFAVESVSPQVAALATAGGASNGVLDGCATVRADVRSLSVTFDEPVVATGSGDPASVTNPANYRLVSPAPGAGFETTSCASGAGGDIVTTIGPVSYDAGGAIATLSVNGGRLLPDRVYRLLVCGSITDVNGNPLDGGGGPDSDFARTFRVDRLNLLADAHFDTYDAACTQAAWSSSDPGAVAVSTLDAGSSPLSGSVANVVSGTGFDLTQCVGVDAERSYEVGAALSVAAPAGVAVAVELGCQFYPELACGGAAGGSVTRLGEYGDTAETFVLFSDALITPADALSAVCGVATSAPLGGSFDALVDDVFIGLSQGVFADGFEGGSLGGWSVAQP